MPDPLWHAQRDGLLWKRERWQVRGLKDKLDFGRLMMGETPESVSATGCQELAQHTEP